MDKRLVVELKNKEEIKLFHSFKVRCALTQKTIKQRILNLIKADLRSKSNA